MEVSTTRSSIRRWSEQLKHREDQLTVVLSLVIGVLVGLMVVAFILLTGRLAAQMYPAGGSAWRRVVIPIIGAAASRKPNSQSSSTTVIFLSRPSSASSSAVRYRLQAASRSAVKALPSKSARGLRRYWEGASVSAKKA
jgi:hypothetical protein